VWNISTGCQLQKSSGYILAAHKVKIFEKNLQAASKYLDAICKILAASLLTVSAIFLREFACGSS
jgi:hypothetical protein